MEDTTFANPPIAAARFAGSLRLQHNLRAALRPGEEALRIEVESTMSQIARINLIFITTMARNFGVMGGA